MSDSFFCNKLNLSIIIFMTAFILRIGLGANIDVGFVPSDGINYHNIAVNLASGNGYSNNISAPYEPYFFREPLYPIMMSSVYFVYGSFGGQLEYINDSDNHVVRKELFWIRVFQAILDSITCLMLFALFSYGFGIKRAFIAVWFFSIYFPVAVIAVYPLREVLQQFLMVGLTLSLFKYFNTRSWGYLVPIGMSLGALILTLQTHILVAPLIVLFLAYGNRRVLKTIRDSAIVLLLATAVLSPWLVRTYMFYPDARILKNAGLSFTWEQLAWQSALVSARNHGVISSDEMYSKLKEWYSLPEHDKFLFSYNGEFSRLSDSLNALTKEHTDSESRGALAIRNVKKALKRGSNSLFRKYSLSKSSLGYNIKHRRIIPLLTYMIGVIIGVVGLVSLFAKIRNHLVILFPVVFYGPLFYVLGSESRRMVVLHSYLFIFFVFAMIDTIRSIKKSVSVKRTMSIGPNH